MKPWKAFFSFLGALCNLVFFLAGLSVAYVLLLKTWHTSSWHFSIWEDPLEEWIALGIAYLIFRTFTGIGGKS